MVSYYTVPVENVEYRLKQSWPIKLANNDVDIKIIEAIKRWTVMNYF